jgi:hypothetical protein
MMNLLNKLKWHRIGYTEGRIKLLDCTLVSRSIMYVREPFLWFKTRKIIEVGDHKDIKEFNLMSPHYRNYRIDVENWLLDGKIDYVSENGLSNPAKIIKLVK